MSVQKIRLKRNRHNLSHYHIGTTDPGVLTPVGCVEVLPGDTFNHRSSSLIRFLPMNAPIMHRVQARIHHFYVPTRIIWDDFEAFITRQSGAPTSVPSLSAYNGTAAFDTLAKYFGVPPSVGDTNPIPISVLPMCAYNFVWNEYFRDKDLTSPLDYEASVVTLADFALRKCCWEKDYFTSARPTPQKGADITLPLGTEAPVIVDSTSTAAAKIKKASDHTALSNTALWSQNSADAYLMNSAGTITGILDPNGSLIADLTNASAATVNSIRRAMKLQALAERLMQFGSDYPSFLASMGVKSSDGRLQRPEYLGGGKVPLSFSEVLQTAEGASTPVGEMRGHGIAPGETRPYRRFFEEHGFVISLLSVRPQAIYSTAMHRSLRHGLIDGPNDFYTPELERIGQQEVYNWEIYPGQDADDDTLGWNDRYGEYRRQFSRVCGDLFVGGALDEWTWARGFAAAPALNQTFVECTPDTRIFAQSTNDNIIYAVNHKLIAQRMLTNNTIGTIL